MVSCCKTWLDEELEPSFLSFQLFAKQAVTRIMGGVSLQVNVSAEAVGVVPSATNVFPTPSVVNTEPALSPCNVNVWVHGVEHTAIKVTVDFERRMFVERLLEK